MQFLLKLLKPIVLLLPIFLLTGCGFHLKHNNGLADKYPQIYLNSTPNGELTRLIKIRLRGAGIEVLDMPDAEVATLKVNGEKRSSRTISLNLKAQNAVQTTPIYASYLVPVHLL